MVKKHYCIPPASSLFAPCQSLGIPLPMCWHLLIPISIPISIFIRILINYIKFALQTCCTNFFIIMNFRLHRMNPYPFIKILNYCVKDFVAWGGRDNIRKIIGALSGMKKYNLLHSSPYTLAIIKASLPFRATLRKTILKIGAGHVNNQFAPLVSGLDFRGNGFTAIK